jgi:hypothetical protein
MNQGTPMYIRSRFSRRRLPLTILGVVALVTLASVAFTIVWGTHNPLSSGSLESAVKPAVPPHLPPPASSPPKGLGKNFQLKLTKVTPTPCPTFALPKTALGPAGTATPSPSRGPTPTPATAPIPPCGSGLLFGLKPNQVCTVFPGSEPTQDQIRQALYTAAQKNNFSFPLVEAVAWQESGWHLLIQACDGGIGLMQIQPDTVQWLNANFHTSYDPLTLDGNANLGVLMLSWLYNYYLPFCNQGLGNGQTCNGDTIWPGATDNATLRDIIVSAYNEGPGTMASYGIQNWNYVNNVLSFEEQFKASQ